MKIEQVSVREVDEEFELSTRVHLAGERTQENVWIRWPAASTIHPQDLADPFAAAFLIPAMALGEDLEVEGTVSASLIENLSRVQGVVRSWRERTDWSRLQPIEIEARTTIEAPPGADRRSLFFTGGVDSFHAFYELRRLRETPNQLLFAHGFDIPLHRKELFDSVHSRLAVAASELGLPLFTVTTNLRQVTDAILSWDLEHGAALAMIGLALGDGHRTAAFGSSDAYVSNSPYGTHIALDPLWSRQYLSFGTVSAGMKRSEKLSTLIHEPVAQAHLRVCYENPGGAYNCGHCTKCVRTMLQLEGLRALGRFLTFPQNVLEKDVDRIIEPRHRLFLWREIAERLAEQPEYATQAIAVRRLISRSEAFGSQTLWQTLLHPGGGRLVIARLRRRAIARMRPYWRRRLRAALQSWRERRSSKASRAPRSGA